jgi:hypothetical protein
MTVMPKVKVVFVAGYGRSGSTLFSIALGSHPQIVGAGELTELSRHAWTDNTHCSCGEPLRSCQFWGPVVQSWMPDDLPTTLESYRRRQVHFENLLVMRVMDLGFGRKTEFAKYLDDTAGVFDSIVRHSGKRIIIDSSKLPSRANALARIGRFELYVVHLVRDGRGVAWSLMKRYKRDVKAGLQRELLPKSPLRTGLRWIIVNLASERLRHIVGPDRYIRVRYEDFVSDPASTLKQVGEMIGCDFREVSQQLQSGLPVNPHHQMAGSRLRMSASIKMEKDEAWKSQMPASKRRLFERMFGWFLARYDYL